MRSRRKQKHTAERQNAISGAEALERGAAGQDGRGGHGAVGQPLPAQIPQDPRKPAVLQTDSGSLRTHGHRDQRRARRHVEKQPGKNLQHSSAEFGISGLQDPAAEYTNRKIMDVHNQIFAIHENHRLKHEDLRSTYHQVRQDLRNLKQVYDALQHEKLIYSDYYAMLQARLDAMGKGPIPLILEGSPEVRRGRPSFNFLDDITPPFGTMDMSFSFDSGRSFSPVATADRVSLPVSHRSGYLSDVSAPSEMLNISGLSDVPMMSTPIRSPRVQEPSDLPGDVSQNLWGVSGSGELFATAPISPLMQKRPDFLGPITPPPETFNIVGKPGFGHYRLLSPIPSARPPLVQEQYDLMSYMTPLRMSTARTPAFDLLGDSMQSPVAAPRTPVMRERLDLLGDITPRPQNLVVSSTPIRVRPLTPPAATMMSPRVQGRIGLLGDITPPAKRMGILSRGRSRRLSPVAVVKSPVRMHERLEFLDQMSPPPEMLDLSQISSAGGSIATSPVPVVTSPLVPGRFSQFSQMSPPAEMLNISGLSSGIGSPVRSPAVLASPVPVYASPVRQTPGDLLNGITPLSMRSNATGLPPPMQAYVSPIRSDHSEIMEIRTPLPGEEVSYFEGRGGEIFEIPSPMKPFMFLGSPGSVLGGRSPPPGTRFPTSRDAEGKYSTCPPH
ncbi:hypothetical protein CEXT_94521 [Caerostris extrusa]|uniref:Uncharacterized protein n=1 Tax=Caerostris extrusa TaxID=172846 RepID=A0AAV4Y036_CAEEX|nr:hypothetical protein CEXT_94521 [Caerostris extrusa]